MATFLAFAMWRTSVDGLTFEEVWETRLEVEIAESGIRTAILSVEKLIQNKRATGRPKDLDDLAFLEKQKSATPHKSG